MKPLRYTLIALAAACGFANAQTAYTTPVGYVTKTLAGDRFNLVGLTVHNPTVSAGVIAAKTDAPTPQITVTGADFATLLGTPGPENTHVLELADGSIQEIVNWGTDTLDTSVVFNSHVTPGTTTYKLRKAATIASVFGATNSAGLKSSPDGEVADANGIPTADTVQIWNGSGFDAVYYFDDLAGTTGWYVVGGGPAENVPLIYADGFFVYRAVGADINLVVTGEVKTTKTAGPLDPGFSYLSAVAPAGLTLGTSDLEDYVSHSADGLVTDENGIYIVDNVQIQQPDGGYLVCYYFDDGSTTQWYTEGGADATNEVLDGGFLVYSVSAATKPYTLAVPSFYSSL